MMMLTGGLRRWGAATFAALLLASSSVVVGVRALDNGFTVPPMGWSSWYGNLWNIDEHMLREMADALVSTGLRDLGYRVLWIDDGFAVGRDPQTRRLLVDTKLFPSGMRALSDYVHDRGLLFGVYTSKGEKTCMGYSQRPGQPDRPDTGACGHEDVDAATYAHEWRIDLLKNDGCGNCPQHEPRDPHGVMRDALNATGRPIYYSVHNTYDEPHDELANDWRTGIDLCCPWYGLWLQLLERATTPEQRARVGPGRFANPDFLQVGWSMAKNKQREGPDFPMMSLLERRSHYTLWAALPAPLILGAELRPGKEWGGIDDPYTFETLTNPEIIAINQDRLAAPMRPVVNDTVRGVQAWLKPLAPVVNTGPGGSTNAENGGGAESFALVLFHRTTLDVSNPHPPNNVWHTPRPDPPAVQRIGATWSRLGDYPNCAAFEVRDLWAKRTLGVRCGEFGADVEEREARIYRFTRVTGARARSGKDPFGRLCGCPEDESPRVLAFGWFGSKRGAAAGGGGGGGGALFSSPSRPWARAGVFVLVTVVAVGLLARAHGGGNARRFLATTAGGYLPVMTEEEGRRK